MIGNGEPADFRSDISTHGHLAKSSLGLGAVSKLLLLLPLRRAPPRGSPNSRCQAEALVHECTGTPKRLFMKRA